MSKPEVVLHRYVLPSVKHEGWAIIVIGSDGFFSAVSDYGNYAYLWSHHGYDDAREFFMKPREEYYYFLTKLCPKPWPYDGEATHKRIATAILEARRCNAWSAVRARQEWELLKDMEVDEGGEAGFARWHDKTTLDEPYEYATYSSPTDAVAFCQKILPRLAEAIRKELQCVA